MKTTVMILTAAAATALALPASAQVLGGQLGGGVSGNLGGQVGLPSTQPLTGAAGQTIRDAARTTRDTVAETRDLAREARETPVGAQAHGGAHASAHADHGQATADLNVNAGATVRGTDGAILGQVVRATRDTAGRVQGFVVRSADGALKAVPATGASVQGDVLTTGWSEAEFEAAPTAD